MTLLPSFGLVQMAVLAYAQMQAIQSLRGPFTTRIAVADFSTPPSIVPAGSAVLALDVLCAVVHTHFDRLHCHPWAVFEPLSP